MFYNVPVNVIEPNVLYLVAGQQSVVYTGVTYNTNQNFRGINGVTGFIYTGTGTTIVNEVGELTGGDVVFEENSIDKPTPFPETTILHGFTIEFELNNSEKIVQDKTIINGFTIELEDYPFYAFQIIETRY